MQDSFACPTRMTGNRKPSIHPGNELWVPITHMGEASIAQDAVRPRSQLAALIQPSGVPVERSEILEHATHAGLSSLLDFSRTAMAFL